ncbi:MAG: hypothetical protein RLZ63_2232 [Pseudomonadota bacterium]|jgi:hypothetical protein
MNSTLQDILKRINQLEEELQAELKRRRDELQADFDHRKIHFERAVLEQQRRFKTGLLHYVSQADLRHVITIPLIYGMLVPMVLLDATLTLYQWLCFPLYRIERVRRKDCWTFDRAHLAYLNALEKLNCAYCSYGNGLAAYFTEIASRTEQYWCPIKHARRVQHAHSRYNQFVDYGDAEGFKAELQRLRDQLQSISSKQEGP